MIQTTCDCFDAAFLSADITSGQFMIIIASIIIIDRIVKIRMIEVNEVYCIGSNKFGQAGAGKKYHNQTFPIFTRIIFPAFVKQVVCGSHHSGLLTLEGRVYMMGSNMNGALGTPSTTTNYSYSPILVDNLCEVSKISSGYYHMCAIAEGKLYSWGKGVDGQLGTGKLVNSAFPVHVESFGEDVEEVSCGLNHTLVKVNNGKVYAFGNGIYGQLGIGSNKNSSTPIAVKIDNVDEIAAGENFSLFLKGNKLYGNGDNSCGQISHQFKRKYALEPTEIHIGKVTAIRAGRLAVATIEDKALCVWGSKSMSTYLILGEIDDYIMDFQTGGDQVYCLASRGELYEWQCSPSMQKSMKLTNLRDKTIMGFSIAESHAIVLGDIIGQINTLESRLKYLQNIEQSDYENSVTDSENNMVKIVRSNSQESHAPSISSEHYSRTPSSIIKQASNFLKAQSKTKINQPVDQLSKQLKKSEPKQAGVQVTEFMKEKYSGQLDQVPELNPINPDNYKDQGSTYNKTKKSSTGKISEREVGECMKKIDEVMNLLVKNSRLEQAQSTLSLGQISRMSTRSKMEKTSGKENRQSQKNLNDKNNRQLIIELREKQLKISELQEKLSRKDIEIQSQRELINLLRKINTSRQ